MVQFPPPKVSDIPRKDHQLNANVVKWNHTFAKKKFCRTAVQVKYRNLLNMLFKNVAKIIQHSALLKV